MKSNILATCSIVTLLATAATFAQDDCKWDVNIMGLVKVGKNKKGEDCTNIGFGLVKTTGDKVDIGYGLVKADGENVQVPKKITIFGKEIEPNTNVSVMNYNGGVSSVSSTPSTVTISHSDCRYGCVNGIGRDTITKDYVLSRKKRNFNIEQYGSIYTLECDTVLQDALSDGLILGVDKKNRVKYDAPQNTSMRFSKTGGQPLCKVLAMNFKNHL